MEIEKYIGRLLTVLGGVEQEEDKCTNRFRRAAFYVLVVTAEEKRYIDDDIATDSILFNKAVCIVYDTFKGTDFNEELMKSLILISHPAALMNCVIEDLSCQQKVISRGGR